MGLSSTFSRFEIVVYCAIAALLMAMIFLRVHPWFEGEVASSYLAPDAEIATFLSIAVPLTIMASMMLAFLVRGPSKLSKRIAPPVRLEGNTPSAVIAFVLFWLGVIGLITVRLFVVPQLGS